ncbi:MAG: hypothetical protein VCA36_09670 [Opitutales bacterium]
MTELWAQEVPSPEQDMMSRRLRLSYVDPVRCVQMLKLFGFEIGSADAPVDRSKLPVVVLLPETKYHTTIPDQPNAFPHTETDPINELLVFYDPAEPGQYGLLENIVRKQIDLPARQIMIEAMVLEISSTALRQLGVQWDLTNILSSGNFLNRKIESTTNPLRIGRIVTPDEGADQVDVTLKGVFREFNVRLKTLIKDGYAEIISRPSVLTLDNRMAYINVSEQIPVANTSYAPGNNYQRTSFETKRAGIQLYVRPRVSADGEEISLQINASVTARVPNGDVVVRNSSGTILASSPTISEREVKTYARIANHTPFIIGGLIAKDSEETIHRVPFVSKLPVLGNLFRSRSVTGLKREVIIVITPFVLPDEKVVNKSMPKDEDRFDSFGNKLFRDAYRIRAEDTFDLHYLRGNRQLKRMQELTERILVENPNKEGQYPYARFAKGAIPGEDILVRRQIYEVLKRREIAASLEIENLIFFESDQVLGSGFKVRFLEDYLKQEAPEILGRSGGKRALAISFTLRRISDGAADLLREPVPDMGFVDCPDSSTWSQLLWDMNKPDAQGRERHAILVRNKDDLKRLKLAILMKKTIELNTERRILSLQNFTRGRLLLMPTVREEDVELIDAEVAECFFCSELYYQSLESELERDFAALRKAIKGTPYEAILDGGG